jgi:hypothetical protein
VQLGLGQDMVCHSINRLAGILILYQAVFGVPIRARFLTTIPDSTSRKFLPLGSLGRKDHTKDAKHAIIFLDFDGSAKKVILKSGMRERLVARNV